MEKHQNSLILFHKDTELFRESILFTAGKTGFSTALIEKDYYCSVLLAYLYQKSDLPLIFRGGTCLSKVYADFYRLSEDIDFTLPTPPNASRSERRKRFAPIKEKISRLHETIPEFKLPEGVKGYNNNAQYRADIFYTSAVNIADESSKMKIEVGLRENLLLPPAKSEARTLLTNPFTRQPSVPNIKLISLKKEEAYAEKIRAALTRKDAAIRDFFDIDYAVTNLNLDVNEDRILKLIIEKLKVPGNFPINISSSRKAELLAQLNAQLKPVLRQADFESFDFDRAYNLIVNIATRVHKEINRF